MQDWGQWLQGGLNTAIDGYIQVETAKANASAPEQIPPANPQPATPTAAVTGAAMQNGMLEIGGVKLDKRILLGTAGVLGLVGLIKLVK